MLFSENELRVTERLNVSAPTPLSLQTLQTHYASFLLAISEAPDQPLLLNVKNT